MADSMRSKLRCQVVQASPVKIHESTTTLYLKKQIWNLGSTMEDLESPLNGRLISARRQGVNSMWLSNGLVSSNSQVRNRKGLLDLP